METCLSVGRQPRSVSRTVRSITREWPQKRQRNALGSKGRNRSLTHRPSRETGESSLPSLPGTLWGVRPPSVPEPLPGGAWAHVDTPARRSVSPHGASRALKGRLPWWGGLAPALADPITLWVPHAPPPTPPTLDGSGSPGRGLILPPPLWTTGSTHLPAPSPPC